MNSNLNAPCRCGVDVRLTVRRAAQYGTLRSRWTGVECQRFIDFEDKEEASERDVGAHGQDVFGRVGFATLRYYRWADGAWRSDGRRARMPAPTSTCGVSAGILCQWIRGLAAQVMASHL